MAQSSLTVTTSNASRETINPVKPSRDRVGKLLKTVAVRKKSEEVLDALTKSLKESDLKVLSFIAACRKNVVKPFPFHLVDESIEGIQNLHAINKRILKLEILRFYLENSNRYKIEDPIIELMHWLICGLQKKQRLVRLSESASSHEAVLQLVNQPILDGATPSLCFKIKYWSQSWENLQWEELSVNKTTRFAFLKTEVDQLHSLIHLGPGSFVNSYSDLGTGVLLTNDLGLCLDSSVTAWVWGKSSIALQMKSVAQVEFIDEEASALTPDSDGSTFYLVNSPAAIRLRFILLFKNDPPPAARPPNVTRVEENRAFRIIDQLMRHLPCLVAYMGLTYFLLKQSKDWKSWSAKGARDTAVTLISQLYSAS